MGSLLSVAKMPIIPAKIWSQRLKNTDTNTEVSDLSGAEGEEENVGVRRVKAPAFIVNYNGLKELTRSLGWRSLIYRELKPLKTAQASTLLGQSHRLCIQFAVISAD